MGARKCCITGCPSISIRPEDRRITFHRFPANNQIRDVWIVNSRLDPNFHITKSTNVCSRHFLKDDFQDSKGKKILLKQNVVPSIFPWSNEEAEASTPPPTKKKRKSSATTSKVAETKKTKLTKSSKSTTTRDEARKNASNSISEAIIPLKKENEPVKKKPKNINFVAGTKVEAQDFNEQWHVAEIMEVDLDEREALIHFDKNQLNKISLSDEWIPMDSCRLRALSSPLTVTESVTSESVKLGTAKFEIAKLEPVEKATNAPASTSKAIKSAANAVTVESVFKVGDKCLARWSDSRKFRATIQKILGNDTYEVLFDDGFLKNVKGMHMTKLKLSPNEELFPERTVIPLPLPIIKTITLQEQNLAARKLVTDNTKLENLPKIPEDGEWCCHWVNDIPIGEHCELDIPNGKLFTIKVYDWRLPIGWTKHIYQRGNIHGKWDIMLISQSSRKFRSKGELKQFLDEIGEEYNATMYDFSLHKKRSKELGFATVINTSILAPKEATDDSTSATITATIPSLDNTVNEVSVGSLKVKFFDNLYHCPKDDCNKNFRKENHLQIHIKHYHKEMEKMLGVCPNMQDLAYLRTNVDDVDTINMKSSRKSAQLATSLTSPTSSGTTPSKIKDVAASKIKKEIIDETFSIIAPIETLKTPLKKELSEIITSTPISTTSLSAVKKEVKETELAGKTEIKLEDENFEPESLIETHIVPKKSFISRRGRRNKRRMHSRNFLNRSDGPPLPKNPRLSIIDSYNDSDDTRLSFGQNPEGMNFSSSFEQYLNETSADANSGPESNENQMDLKSSIPKYINENGEVIKIVRMREEEIINCVCQFMEEDGLMIQCELCLCWQHGSCNGIEKENQVPDKYICFICKNPERGRDSKKYIHDQDWLYDGKLPVANYHVVNLKLPHRFEILKQSHTLTGNLLEIKRYLHSLKVKINIAENKDHPKLYYWSKKWEPSSPVKTATPQPQVIRANTNPEIVIDSLNIENNKLSPYELGEVGSISKSEQDSINNSILAGLLSSPGVSQPTNAVACNGPITAADIKIPTPIDVKIMDVEINNTTAPIIPQPEEAIDSATCQLQLLQHIQRQQNLAMARLQTIEAQVIALEALDENLLDTSYQTNSFPKTKETIKMLMNDVGKMRKFASIHKEPIANNYHLM